MPCFSYDGLNFNYREKGAGQPFVFQHGLGGDVEQPFSLFKPPHGIRLIAFDCRAHGCTQPIGSSAKIALESFAIDLAALLDHLQLERAVVGGISMGAAVALKFARRCGSRLMALVLSRPAWLVGPNHANAAIFGAIAQLLRTLGPERGKQEFVRSELFQRVAAESSDAADSLCGQFDNLYAVERAARLERIPLDAAIDALAELNELHVPTLVLANRHDPIHPYVFGEAIAQAIPNAEFQEITAKSICRQLHANDMQRHLSNFFQQHFL